MVDQLEREVDRNFDTFLALLPEMIQEHQGEFVLMRDQKIVGLFTDLRSALAAGATQFGDGIYSVQEIADRPADLGFFSHAVDTRIA